VASRGKNQATSADAWLIEGAEPAGTEAAEKAGSEDDFSAIAPPRRKRSVAKNIGAATRQWLQVPKPTNGGSAAEVRETQTRKQAPKAKAEPKPKAKPAKAEPKKSNAKGEESSDLAKRIRELQTELRVQAKEAKAELTAALRERDSLRKRVEQLEAQLADAKKRVATKTTRRGTSSKTRAKAATRPKAEPKAPARRRAPARKNGQLDLNAATFEELRDLGLSVTQSARVIAYRDVRGGYDSLDELDEVPGLSEQTRGDLRAQLRLPG
jgi:DNA uptake protein ComE-like DNA-binding protein